MIESGDEDPDMLTTTDVAGRLGYSDDTVRRLCEQGCFDGDRKRGVPSAWRPGVGAHWRIPVAAVELYVERVRTRVLRRPLR